MPTYYKKRKTTSYGRRYKKKTYARRKRVYNKRKAVYRQNLKIQRNRFSALPEVMYTKLSYFENNYKFALGNLDKLNRIAFRFNSPYDPVMQTFNKSANYFDVWMPFYKYCRVMGAKFHLKFANDVENTRQMQFCLIPNVNNYAYQDMDELATQIRKKMSTWNNSIGSVRSLKQYLPIHTIFMITKQQYNSQLPGTDYDITHSGTSYTDVQQPAQVDLYYAKIDEGGQFPTQCLGSVRITFYCKFYSRIPRKPLGTDIGEAILDDGETVTFGDADIDEGPVLGPDEFVFPPQ